LTQESDDRYSAVLVSLWKVDLIAKDHKPLASLAWSHLETRVGLLYVAIMVERLQDELWSCRAREVDEDHLHVREFLQRRHQSHRLAGTRRTAQQEWTFLAQPAAEYFLMAIRINCCNHNICICDFLGINVNDRDRFLPQVPFLIIKADFIVNE